MKSITLAVGTLTAALALVGCAPSDRTGTGGGNGGGSGVTGGGGGSTSTQKGSLSGSVTNEAGVSGEADNTGTTTPGYGGAGTLSATSSVQLVIINDDGSLDVLATSSVDAQGSYTLQSERRDGVQMIEALNGQGTVIARTLVTQNVVVNEAHHAQPITSESSVEAAAFLQLVRSGHRPQDIDMAMLRARIDERVAVAVRESGNEGSAGAQLNVLASAVWSAQTSQREAWRRASIDASARVQAELAILADYDEALFAQAATEGQINQEFRSRWQQAELQGQADVSVVASAESTISSSTRRVLEDASVNASASLRAAWARATAQREAMISTAAMVQLMTEAQASQESLTTLDALNASLVASIDSSADVNAISAAYVAWRAGIRGVSSAQDQGMGLMGLIQVQVALYVSVVTQVIGLADQLDAQFRTAVTAAHTSGNYDFSALATASLDVNANFRAQTDSNVRNGLTGMTEAQTNLVVRTLITSESSWR